MCNECMSTPGARPLDSQKGRCNRTSPTAQARHGACDSVGAEPQPIDIPSGPLLT